MRSKICSSKYIKTVSKGKGWIPAFLTLGYLLAFPVAGLLMLGNWSGIQYTPAQMSCLYENLWRDGFLAAGGIVTGLAALFNGINGFIYLYSKKQTDFYHSLPVKRSRMFWNRVYTGLVYYLVPYVIMEFFAVCIGAARGFFSLRLMLLALGLLLLHLLLYFLVYFSVVLVICVTGHLLMGMVCLIAVYTYGPLLSLLLTGYRTSFYQTYCLEYPYGLIQGLREAASPGTLAVSFYEAYGEGGGKQALLLIFLVTAVFAFLSYIAYTRRPSEAAGRPMVYRKAALVMKFLIVVPCGLGVGYIFYLFTTASIRVLWWIFGLILGTILAHGIMEIAYEMDFHCFFKKKLQLLAVGTLVAVCAIVYQTGLLRYDAYIPAQDKIASVSMDMKLFADNTEGGITSFPDGTFEVNDYSSWDKVELAASAGKQIGDKTYEALRKIVKNQKQRTAMDGSSEGYQEGDREYITFSARFMYRLDSGRKVYREYKVSADESRELLTGLYEEENLKEKLMGPLELDIRYLDEIYFSCADGNGYVIFQDKKEKRQQLVKALKKDMETAAAEEVFGIPCGSVQMSYRLPGRLKADRLVPGRSDTDQYAYNNINIYPSYKNTLRLLKETGYPLSLDEASIKKVTIVYYYEDGQEKKTVEYTKPEEIKAIADAAVPVIGDFPWLDYVYDISAAFQMEGNNESYLQLMRDKLPDFVKKELESQK